MIPQLVDAYEDLRRYATSLRDATQIVTANDIDD